MSSNVERQKLVTDLLDSVKQCQVRFGGRNELATELDKRVVKLCSSLEAVLSHGLRKNRTLFKLTREVALKGLPKSLTGIGSNSNELITFWHFVRLHLNRHEYERYMVLKNVHSDIGRGRAWLRSSLNENSLERYVLMILADDTSTRNSFYEDWALLMDEEKNSMLPTISRGLSSILFAINIDNIDLNGSASETRAQSIMKQKSEPLPVIVASSAISESEFRKRKSRRTPRVNVVSLDDDEEDTESAGQLSFCSAQSAPPTCLSSPESLPSGPRLFGDSGCFIATEWSGRHHRQVCESEPEMNDSMGPSVLLTPICDNVSIGELALPSGEDEVSDTERHTSSELRDALGTILQRKENLEEKTVSLKEQLQKTKEEKEGIEAELECFKKKQEEKVSRLESQQESLVKENDILKLQLKKYIGAIQLLKQEQRPLLDQPVANEYEKKLVQVAEMHGELVEFNDRLHRVILQKEAIIRRLREELVELRGPLPDGGQSDDDDLSIDISSLHSVPSPINRPLINVWIPTAFLAGQQKTSSSHHVYQVYVRIKDEEWNVYRRYSQFHGLHKHLKKKNPIVQSFDFPPKKTIGNRDAKVVQERRKRLEHYLRCVVNMVQSEHILNDKSNLVSVLPFLGEKKVQSNRSESRSRSDTHLSRATTSVSSSQQQHYIGL